MNNIFDFNKNILDFFYHKKDHESNFDNKYLDKNNLLDYYSVLTGNEIEAYNKKLREVEKIIKIVNEIEKKTGIPYFTMKSFLSYPFLDNDIDFIVTGNGYKEYVKELKLLGFSHNFDLSDIREPMKCAFINESYSIIIHLHSEVSWNGIITCDKDDVFKYIVWYENEGIRVRVPSQTDELLIAIGHFLFENYYFKLGEFIYNDYLLNSKIDYYRIDKISCEYGYNKGVALFFSYLHALSCNFDLGLNIPSRYYSEIKIVKNKLFPYYIPYKKLIPTYLENFNNGIRQGKIINLFRKIFTFTIVGYLWKYKLPKRRQKKFLSHFQD